QWTTTVTPSAGRGNDRLLIEVLPFARLVEDRGRVDDLQWALVQGRLDCSAHGDELAARQDLLTLLADQEVEKQDRRVRVWGVSREPFRRRAGNRRRNDEPIEWRAPPLRLLGQKPVGRECDRHPARLRLAHQTPGGWGGRAPLPPPRRGW